MLIVGESERTRPIRRALSDLPLQLQEMEDVLQALDPPVDSNTAGILLVLPLRGFVPEHAVSLLVDRRQGGRPPVFVIVPDGAPISRSSQLYRRGASGVFTWATDAELLPRLMEGVLDPSPELRGDRVLASMVHSRLRAAPSLDDRIQVAADRGIVRLAGRVDRLWRKRQLQDFVSHIPGVVAVEAEALEVEPSGLPDRAVGTSIRELLRGASSIEEHTLAVSVQDGHAVLAGTVLNREEWLHARRLISMVEGVRSVANRTVAAPRRKLQDGRVARRLRGAVRRRLSAAREVHVAMLGRTAVLRGRVRLSFARERVEELVNGDAAVGRVINKLEVC